MNNNKQIDFLLNVKLRNESVSIFLINGIRLRGIVYDFDDVSIMIKGALDGSRQMVYKSSISSIMI